eukprot:114128-Alexandrium_andersonii.AAC.1
MSASLVGSEMCIRDSTGHLPMAWTPRREASSPPRRPLPPDRRRATGESAPVSYTHLTLPTICSV